ncbi:MAG: hypothetical protein GY821_01995, partial [Gammaproteobacteria bacterium]|nr:hypothetical protein [Gammaproteobacteria bacterium]
MYQKSDVINLFNTLIILNRQYESRSQLQLSALKAEVETLRNRVHESVTEHELAHQLTALHVGVDQLVRTERVTKADVNISHKKLVLAFSEQFR